MKPKLLSLFCCFFALSQGFIYRDEVGVTDWYRKNVGAIKDAYFHSTPAKRNIYVSTEANVIAALSMKSGEVVWRHLLPDPIDVLKHKGNALLSISGKKSIHLWDVQGDLLWNEQVNPKNSKETNFVDALFVGDENVAVLINSVLQLRSGTKGQILWSKEIIGQKLLQQDNSLVVIGVSSSKNALQVTSFSKEGNVLSEKTISHSSELLPSSLRIFTSSGVVKDSQGELFEFSLESLTLRRVGVNPEETDSVWEGSGSLGAQISQEFSVLRKGDEDVWELRGNHHVLAPPDTLDGDTAMGVVTLKENNLTLDVVHMATGKVDRLLNEISFPSAPLKKSFLQRFPKKDNSVGFRLLLVAADEKVTLITASGSVWEREEALGHVISVATMDLPSTHIFENSFAHLQFEEENPWDQWLTRIEAQRLQLTEWIWGTENEEAEEVFHRHLTKDQFGFRQLILLVTDKNSIFGLHSEDGHIIWKFWLPEAVNSTLHVVRHSSNYPPEIALFYEEPLSHSSQEPSTIVLWMNAFTGEEYSRDTYPFVITHSFVLPFLDPLGTYPVIAVDTNLDIHILSRSPLAVECFQEHQNEVFFTLNDNSELRGMRAGAQKSSRIFASEVAWQLPFTSERILKIVPSHWDEKVYSPTKVLGNRTAIQKYLNKNLLAVATFHHNPGKTWEDGLRVYLVDSVSGRIVFSTSHPSSSPPIHFTNSENWFVYHYWNSKAHQFEMSVIELYEREFDWEGTEFSSFTADRPLAYQQAFIFPSGVKTLGVTRTLHGITNKQILVGLQSGQVMGLSKSFLDPRRPPKASVSQEDKEEGLIPYDALLPITPKAFLNYYQQILDLREIYTSPTQLESTSAVIAVGIDLFGTRTAPSKTFDLLNYDFNRWALLATTISLLIVTYLSFNLAKRSELNRLWK